MTNPAIRLKFKKFGGLKYISHLDLQRAVLRFIKRAKLPIRYTEGFNPHPKIVFALTLSVGTESECELVDVYLARDPDNPEIPVITPDDFVARLREVLPNGLEVIDAYYPDCDFGDIVSSDYEITLYKKEKAELAPKILEAMSHPIEITKKGKAGERQIDVVPLVFGFSSYDTDDTFVISATLSAKPNEYLNPDLFVKGLLETDVGHYVDTWQTKRVAINFKEGK